VGCEEVCWNAVCLVTEALPSVSTQVLSLRLCLAHLSNKNGW
jgi:hypothetical protein